MTAAPSAEKSLVDAMANLDIGEPKNRYGSIAALASPGATWSAAEFPLPGRTDPRFVFFDLETTGVGATSRIIQFGATTVDPMTLVEISRVSLFVRAHGITPDITRITHIAPDRVSAEPEFAGRAEQIFSVLDGAVWAGYNIIKFDIPRLKYEFGLLGHRMPRCAGILDVYAVAAAWGTVVHTGNLKLDTLSQYYGYGVELHDASDDALKTFQVLRSMVTARAIRKMIDSRSCEMNAGNDDDSLPPATSVAAAASATSPAIAVAPARVPLRDAALASRRAFHRGALLDLARSSERQVKDDPTTWPKDAFVGADAIKGLFGIAFDMNRDPGSLKIPVGEGHSVSAVGVYGAYKKGDGSARTYLLVPQTIENIVVHAHDALEEATLRAATAAASDPRLLGGDVIKTFVFRRFLWAFLALVIT